MNTSPVLDKVIICYFLRKEYEMSKKYIHFFLNYSNYNSQFVLYLRSAHSINFNHKPIVVMKNLLAKIQCIDYWNGYAIFYTCGRKLKVIKIYLWTLFLHPHTEKVKPTAFLQQKRSPVYMLLCYDAVFFSPLLIITTIVVLNPFY